MIISDIESSSRKVLMKESFLWLSQFFYKYKKYIFFILILLILTTTTMAFFPYFMGYIVDNAIKKGDNNLLVKFTIVLIFLYLGIFIIKILNFYFTQKIAQKVLFDIRKEIFKKILSLKIDFFDRTSTGSILTRLINDIDGLAQLFSHETIGIVIDIVQIIVIFIAMININIKLSLIVLCFFPIIVFTTKVYIKKALVYFMNSSEQRSILTGFLAEIIGGITNIQNFHAQYKFKDKFNIILDKYIDAKGKAIKLHFSFWPVNRVYEGIITIIVLIYGINMVNNGQCSVGIIVSFLAYIRFLFDPLHHIGDTATNIQSSISNVKRIIGLLNQEEEVDEKDLLYLDNIKGDIEFKDVWFSYYNDKPLWVLKGVNFKIKQGEELAIVGATGSGKTTIMNLIMKFYDIQKGDILIDGISIKKLNRETIRKKAAYVLQDPHLFSRTFKDNITFFEKDVNEDHLNKVIETSKFNKVTTKFPTGIDTFLLEQGSNLSTGEKQLLSFARALYIDPKIIFLDEATANVDLETEKTIQNSKKELISGKTSIIIAHRLSTILDSDKIIVLKNGKIVEQGKHNELLKNRSEYFRLYNCQFNENN